MKKINYLKFTILILFTFIVSLGFVFLNDDEDDFELIKNLEIYHSVFKELRINYVDDVKTSELVTYSIKQLLLQLDPYTIYYPENVVEDYTFMNSGEFGGIGLTVDIIDNKIIVTDIVLNQPANLSGINIGDEIIEIENIKTEGKTMDEIGSLLKGETGSIVIIKIQNSENKLVEHSIIRTSIESKNVSYYTALNNEIGYIKLENFLPNAGMEVREAYTDLTDNNELKGLILDLRGNPGGLLIEAVNIVNIFVEKDIKVVEMKGKSIQSQNTFLTTSEPLDTQIPIVVIINGHSASASEIVSGALQDLDRAVIVGQRSYGKGLVQLTKDLLYNTKMKITTAKYYIPSGRCIQAHPSLIRDKNKEITNVPDSVLVEFKTKSGRKVYDGAGICPDIIINRFSDIEFIDSLESNHIFFKFAYQYHKNNTSIEEPNEFKVTNQMFTEFSEYIENNFSYNSGLEFEVLALLENDEILDNNDLKQKVLGLSEEIKKNQANLKNEYAEELKVTLGKEIIKHFYFKEGVIEYDLYNLPEIVKAVEIFNNLEFYNTLIKP